MKSNAQDKTARFQSSTKQSRSDERNEGNGNRQTALDCSLKLHRADYLRDLSLKIGGDCRRSEGLAEPPMQLPTA